MNGTAYIKMPTTRSQTKAAALHAKADYIKALRHKALCMMNEIISTEDKDMKALKITNYLNFMEFTAFPLMAITGFRLALMSKCNSMLTQTKYKRYPVLQNSARSLMEKVREKYIDDGQTFSEFKKNVLRNLKVNPEYEWDAPEKSNGLRRSRRLAAQPRVDYSGYFEEEE
jgi:hypothetical protein